MSDYVKRMTADDYCDFCRTNLEICDHESWCPIVEIERLRAALLRLRDEPIQSPEQLSDIIREALEDE